MLCILCLCYGIRRTSLTTRTSSRYLVWSRRYHHVVLNETFRLSLPPIFPPSTKVRASTRLATYLVDEWYIHIFTGEAFRETVQSVLGVGVFNADGEMWK